MTDPVPAAPAPVAPVKLSLVGKVSAFVKAHKVLSIVIAVVVIGLIVVGLFNGVHPAAIGRGK